MNVNIGRPITGMVSSGWIKESFLLFTKDAAVWILSTLIYLAIIFGIQVAFGVPTIFTMGRLLLTHHSLSVLPEPSPVKRYSQEALSFLLYCFFDAGLYLMANKSVRGEKLTLFDLVSGGSRYPSFAVYCIFNNIAGIVGLLGCCVGVLVTSFMVWPGNAAVMDGKGAQESLLKSINATKQDWLNGAAFFLLFGLLKILSAIPLCLGLLVTYPMSYIIGALAYRDLIGMPGISGEEVIEVGDGTGWPPPPSGV